MERTKKQWLFDLGKMIHFEKKIGVDNQSNLGGTCFVTTPLDFKKVTRLQGHPTHFVSN